MEISKRLFSANWGLEREVLRVDPSGRLADTPHPFPPGHRKITVDYAEAQVELITGVHSGPLDALEELESLQAQLEERLGDELLWPFSLPATWTEGQAVLPAQFAGDPGWDDQRRYRKTLEQHHGGARQVLSGIHVNYSFGPDHPGGDYFALARHFLRFQPIITYLFSFSPWLTPSYQRDLTRGRSQEAVAAAERCGPRTSSVRQGPLGYVLPEAVEEAVGVRYDSLEEYLEKLHRALTPSEGRPALLSHEREFYAAVRPKGRTKEKGKTLEALARDGVEYLEFRSFDLDPLAPWGIRKDTLRFLELFLAAGAVTESPPLSDQERAKTRRLLHDLAQCSWGRSPGAPRAVRRLWARLAPLLHELAPLAGPDHVAALGRFQDQLEGRAVRDLERVSALWGEGGPLRWGLERARLHRAWSGLELSTKLLIEEADRRGFGVELLDASENFVVLKSGARREYVKQATRTSADPYVAALVMENKEVTKRVLRQAGLVVPEGAIFSSAEAALKARATWEGRKVVIKPNATNFGDGVTILEASADLRDWDTAVTLAFSLDQQILIEDFAPGLEFRFLVLGGRTHAILHRVPANVVGDGVRSIRELVDEKNRHPWRGEGYRKPLEKLRLDAVEQEFLAAQGWNPDRVPASGQRVFLRKNSNISTGGDSIDFTDLMPARYARLAERASAAVGAQICGLDMILPNWKDDSASGAYTILELNFNPALHIHAFPAEGTNRRPEAAVLDLLFQKRVEVPTPREMPRLRGGMMWTEQEAQ